MSVLDYVMGMKSAGAGGGSGDNSLIITFNSETGQSDQTWEEIKAALLAGKTVYLDNGSDLCGFKEVNSIYNDDVAQINIYFGNNYLAIDTETGCLYFPD